MAAGAALFIASAPIVLAQTARTDPIAVAVAVAITPAASDVSSDVSSDASSAASSASNVDGRAADALPRPQDDFFRSVNGAWLKTAVIPPDKTSLGTLQEIFDATQVHLRELIDEAQRHADDADAVRVGDFYASFMDEATIEKRGLAPLAGELAAIDSLGSAKQLGASFARLDRLDVETPFGMGINQDDRDSTRYVPSIGQSGLGLPDRDYYLKLDDPKFAELRGKYALYIASLLRLSGAEPTEADASARAVLALETEIAKVQWTRVENRDPVKTYNKVRVDALRSLAPALDWDSLLVEAGVAGKSPDIIVNQPSYFQRFNPLLEGVPLSTWKAYERFHLLSAYAPYMSKAFVDARFEFVGKALNGLEANRPRWMRGITVVDQSIGENLGKLYVGKYFPPSSKSRMDQLVANLLAAYRQSMLTNDWMGPETKKAALEKLAKFNNKIGYPKRWIDYSTLVVRRDDLAGNVMRARRFEDARQLAKLGHPIDRDEWGMKPQTINAYYNPSLNEIVFPAAFLQPPLFDAAADDAANYGAVGAVIGHEISHGFDDQGSQYDGDGNLRDWWTPQDRERYGAKTKALVAQYSAFVAVPGYHVDGALTLGENIADNSGLAIAYKAYHVSLGNKPAPVIGGFSGDERFFRAFALAWRNKIRDESLLSQIKSDPHAPNVFRVNGTVRNHPAFYSTFGVKPGDGMYLPPAERVSIW